MPDFHELVARFIRTRGGKKALAEKLGMTPSGLGRALEAGTMQVENLLLLSKTVEVPPEIVLRVAGKGEIADLLREFYGDSHQPIAPDRAELLSLYESLPEPMRVATLSWLRAAAGSPPQVERHRKTAG